MTTPRCEGLLRYCSRSVAIADACKAMKIGVVPADVGVDGVDFPAGSNARSAAKVAFDLKDGNVAAAARVGVEQVRERALAQKLLHVVVRKLAILKARGKVQQPRAAPARPSASVLHPAADRDIGGLEDALVVAAGVYPRGGV